MAEPLLQLLDAVRETAAVPAVPDPIRDEFLPAMVGARSVADSEKVLHAATVQLEWLSKELGKSLKIRESNLRQHLRHTADRLLHQQDQLRLAIAAAIGEPPAQEALLAQETFRRFLVETQRQLPFMAGEQNQDIPDPAKPTFGYLLSVVLRLVLLVLAVEHLASKRRAAVLPELTHRAFDTAQLLRDLIGRMDGDLTPWLDVPDVRAHRIAEAASSFWSSFTPEEQETMSEAWTERTELPPRWE